MTKAKHTQGPWKAHPIQICQLPFSAVTAKTLLAKVYSEAFGDHEESEANARRIAACVNACEGFSIEELDGANLFQDSIKSAKVIDDLLEALQLCLKAFRHETYHADTIRMDAEDAAVSAIAKAKGGQQ